MEIFFFSRVMQSLSKYLDSLDCFAESILLVVFHMHTMKIVNHNERNCDFHSRLCFFVFSSRYEYNTFLYVFTLFQWWTFRYSKMKQFCIVVRMSIPLFLFHIILVSILYLYSKYTSKSLQSHFLPNSFNSLFWYTISV